MLAMNAMTLTFLMTMLGALVSLHAWTLITLIRDVIALRERCIRSYDEAEAANAREDDALDAKRYQFVLSALDELKHRLDANS